MLPAVWHGPPHGAGHFACLYRGDGPVVSPQFCPHPAAHFSRSHRFAPAGPSCPSAGDGPDRPVELGLSAPAPVQYQRLRLSVQHDHGQKLVQRGAVCPLYPGCNAGTALPQLAGCPLLVDAHQSALRQHPCPAGTLSSPAGGGRLPSQSPAGAAGAGVPVRLCPAHLLSESVP